MPLVTLTVRRGKDAAFKSAVLNAVHNALVASGVPQTDRFHRVLELSPEDFRYDASYPDLAKPRSDDFVLIEVLLSVGRNALAAALAVVTLFVIAVFSQGAHMPFILSVNLLAGAFGALVVFAAGRTTPATA